MKAIISAGGKGTRLRPLTYSTNKQLLPIANKPLLLYSLETIINSSIKQVGIIVNESRKAVEELIGDGKKFGIKVTYIDQPEPLGVAHVVKISEKFINKDDFVYLLGDNIFTTGLKKPLTQFKKSEADAILTVIKHQENYRLGVPYFDSNGKLIKVVEKPTNPPNQFGVPGMYIFSSKVFNAFQGRDAIKPSARGELEIVDLYNYMLKKGNKVEVVEIDGHWRDPGKFNDFLEANKLIIELYYQKGTNQIKGNIDKDSKITGGIILGQKSKIINAQVVGPVIIGDSVEIRNSYIGPYTSIADNCEIVNSKVEYSILLENVHITDVKGKIEASMVGKHTEISPTKQGIPSYSFMVADHCRIDLPF